MKKWLIGIGVLVLVLAGLGWWLLLDARAPTHAPGIDIAAYRALVANDAPDTLPRDVRVEFVGDSQAPSFAAVAGDFSGPRTLTFTAFQLTGPAGAVVIDGAVDQATLTTMSEGRGVFRADAYARVLEAVTQAAHVLITHEHLDHVMAIARHPEPEDIAPRLRLTAPQLAGLPEHAIGGTLAPEIAAAPPHDFAAPTRIAPGVVAHAAPGHTPGTILIYARTHEREYLFIGDIAWAMASIERLTGRPRLIRYLVPAVDPDRPAVLRQLRALHELAAAEPALIIVPAHDEPYLRRLTGAGAIQEGFITEAQQPAPAAP